MGFSVYCIYYLMFCCCLGLGLGLGCYIWGCHKICFRMGFGIQVIFCIVIVVGFCCYCYCYCYCGSSFYSDLFLYCFLSLFDNQCSSYKHSISFLNYYLISISFLNYYLISISFLNYYLISISFYYHLYSINFL